MMSKTTVIYIVGVWVNTGPRANDCYFEPTFIGTNPKDILREYGKHQDCEIQKCLNNSGYMDWGFVEPEEVNELEDNVKCTVAELNERVSRLSGEERTDPAGPIPGVEYTPISQRVRAALRRIMHKK